MLLERNRPIDDRTPVQSEDRPDRSRKKPVLIILHQSHSNPGHVGCWLREAGFHLDIRRPRYGDALPETLEAHSGAIIFGGPMSANDDDEYVRREIDWIAVPLAEQKPFLGICLGAQMLVRQLGGRVEPHPDGLVEIGYFPIKPTVEGKALFDWPSHVYEWHTEGFALPTGATALATGDSFSNQAFSFGPAAYGVQFHPEISELLINRWTVRAAHKLAFPGARPRPEHLAHHLRYGPGQLKWLDRFMRHWTGLHVDV